jgi:hypothetical protein
MMWIISIYQLLSGNLYLDPGSGSFLLQLLIAAIAGIALAVKIYWRRIAAFFKKDESQPTGINQDNDTHTPDD